MILIRTMCVCFVQAFGDRGSRNLSEVQSGNTLLCFYLPLTAVVGLTLRYKCPEKVHILKD